VAERGTATMRARSPLQHAGCVIPEVCIMGGNDKKRSPEIGRNLGQGLGNIRDQQRRDLAGSGEDAPTQDQAGRPTSGEQGAAREDRNDPSR
jgi:hypothetical protein